MPRDEKTLAQLELVGRIIKDKPEAKLFIVTNAVHSPLPSAQRSSTSAIRAAGL